MAMFKTLNDAAQFQPILAVGSNYKIWYSNDIFFRDAIMGYAFMKEKGLLPTIKTLKDKYVEVGSIVGPTVNGEDSLEEVLEFIYSSMQGEQWSPEGEAREFILGLGIRHTSMSVGDIIQKGDEYWMIKSFGFVKLF